MTIASVKRTFLQRILGTPATGQPGTPDCWSFENGKLIIELDEAPELRPPDGALRFEGGNLPVRILVVHDGSGNYRAYRNRCTHFGHRRLDPVPGTDTIQCCSINKSTFDSAGDNIHGPAGHPITRYTVELDSETNRLIVLIP